MDYAELYHGANNLQFKDNKDLIEEFHDELATGRNILDVGCGDGKFTVEILKKMFDPDAKIIGVDKSKNMVDFAKNKYPASGMKFMQLDIESKDDLFKQWTDKFDVVTMFYSFHWVAERRSALENIFNCLKNQGLCLFIYPLYTPVYDSYKVMRKDPFWKDVFMKTNAVYITIDNETVKPVQDLENLLSSIGFTDITVKIEKKNFVFGSLTEMEEFLISVNPFLSDLPTKTAIKFYQQQRDLFLEASGIEMPNGGNQKNMKITKQYSVMIAFCRKE